MKKRVVIAGFGDTGLLVAIHLGSDFDIIGITPKPCLVSGQELGARIARPDTWKKDYLMAFEQYKQLDNVRTVHGLITDIDTGNTSVTVQRHDGGEQTEPYDVLLIASGVTNGFWRNNAVQDMDSIHKHIDNIAAKMARAQTVAVIGGGATGVSVAGNLAEQYPDKTVHLFYSKAQPLPGYHPNTRDRLEQQLKTLGVQLHANHRATIPDGFNGDELTSAAIEWSSGQPPMQADLTLWATGNTKPNNDFIPKAMLDEQGYVKADDKLRVEGFSNVFTVGDIAATDPHRSSARNWGFRLAANNIRAHLQGDESAMQTFTATPYRWGSVMGVQANGLQVFQANGKSFRFPRWVVKMLLFPLAVRKAIYKGVRKRSTV